MVVLLRSSVFLLIFCLILLATENGVLMSPSMIVDFSILLKCLKIYMTVESKNYSIFEEFQYICPIS